MTSPKLRLAIVGCGWVADWHVADGVAHLSDKFQVIAACDIDERRAREFAKRYGIERACRSLEEVLSMADVDVVAVCTPPALHFQMVRACLLSNKHVVCEKPFAKSLAEVDAIIEMERGSRARVMPIFQYRFGDGIARVKSVIDSGLAGRHFVSSVETAKRRGPDYYAVPWRGKFATELGGVLLTQAIHIHDLLLWLIGPASDVSCFKTTRVNPIEVEDCAVASLRMKDGSLASLTATLGSVRQVTRLRLCFENVTFEKQGYDDDSLRPGEEPWTIVPKSPEIGDAIRARMETVPSQKTWFPRQYELFHDALHSGQPFPVTLQDARTSIELITALFSSDRTGTVSRLPIDERHPDYGGWIPQTHSSSAPAMRTA